MTRSCGAAVGASRLRRRRRCRAASPAGRPAAAAHRGQRGLALLADPQVDLASRGAQVGMAEAAGRIRSRAAPSTSAHAGCGAKFFVMSRVLWRYSSDSMRLAAQHDLARRSRAAGRARRRGSWPSTSLANRLALEAVAQQRGELAARAGASMISISPASPGRART